MRIGNVQLRRPVMNAACSIAKTLGDVKTWCATNSGAVVVGSVTVEPRDGNEEQRWYAGDGFALNSFGMPNGGAEYYRKHLPEMAKTCHEAKKPLILSIAGFSSDEYCRLAKLASSAKVDLLELNLGCPNVMEDGAQKPIASFDKTWLREIIMKVSAATDIPLMLKLSPYSNPAELAEIADTIARTERVAAVVTSNSFPNGFLQENGQPVLGNGVGGVSGRALLPIALGQVRQFRQRLPENIAVVGVGGIESSEDLEQYLAAGTAAVQVATLVVRDGHQAIDTVIAP
jgi:dihydroorotate dehydrogenase (fumarate)